eukprot:403332905
MNYYNQTQNQHSNFINLETPSQPKKPLLLGVNEIQNSNMNPRQNSNYPQKQNSSSYQLPPDQQNLSTDYQNNQNLQVASQFNSHDYACNYGEYQQIGQGNSVSGQQMIPQNQLLQAGQIYLVKLPKRVHDVMTQLQSQQANSGRNSQELLDLGEICLKYDLSNGKEADQSAQQAPVMRFKEPSGKVWKLKLNILDEDKGSSKSKSDREIQPDNFHNLVENSKTQGLGLGMDVDMNEDEDLFGDKGSTVNESFESLKQNAEKQKIAQIMNQPTNAIICEDLRKRGSQMLPVSCRVNTVPQMYQVREEVKSGLFRSDEVLTKKINVTNISQYQVPFEFKINREDELRQSPDKDRSANGMSDSDYDQRSRTLQKTRGRPPAPTSFGQKQKRVTMPQPQLQENLFRLFKDTQEFKIHELEVILNHPRGTLKETLTQMCRYDNKRKVYSLREDFQP